MKKLLAIILCAALCGCEESKEDRTALFEAWKAANPHYADLTEPQWQLLRKNSMLPGVDYATKYAKEAKDSADAAMILSAAANASTNSKK